MPIVKRTIGGREYSFAPLLYGHWEDIADGQLASESEINRIRNWWPRIESSIKRAGGEMPDRREMDVDEANTFLAGAITAILAASGMKKAEPGEAIPAAASETSVTTSSVSS